MKKNILAIALLTASLTSTWANEEQKDDHSSSHTTRIPLRSNVQHGLDEYSSPDGKTHFVHIAVKETHSAIPTKHGRFTGFYFSADWQISYGFGSQRPF